MEIWFLILVSISLSLLVKAIFDHLISPPSNPNKKAQSPPPGIPPGPTTLPILGNLFLLQKSFSEIEPILRSLHSKLGPMVTLRIGSRPSIFISDRSLAYQALVQNGAIFADRPKAVATSKILSSNQHNISSAGYGPTWRLLRRNLTSEILHPSRVKSYSHARKWVLQILVDRLQSCSPPIRAVDHFHYVMFCLLVLMCFGDKLREDQIKEIEQVQRHLLLNMFRYNILNFFPRITKIFLRKKWTEFMQLRKGQEDVIIPLIRAREKVLKEEGKKEEHVLAYVDTLFNLELPDEKRKLNEGEMVSLCSEFLNGGTDTTATALQWIMANLVKYPLVQGKLFAEIKGVLSNKNGNPREVEAEEEDLKKMKYLKAVVLEGLRRHPPGHFVLPHAVSEDVVLGDHLVPKNGTVNFMVADMGWDPAIWGDPMDFRPERFLGKEEDFDVTGSKGIKMMPFGVGRRICPAYGLAILHLEFFVANLVWRFEWKPMEGVGVDLAEKQEFTMVMKEPLQVQLIPRF